VVVHRAAALSQARVAGDGAGGAVAQAANQALQKLGQR